MGLFSFSKKEKIVAIFDIGSGSVGGALVSIPLDGKSIPVIMKSVRTDMNFDKNVGFSHFLTEMIKALNSTAISLYNKKGGAPDEIVCTLASPWYLSETRVIKIKKEKQFVFTKFLASDLINKEISNLMQSYKEKYNNLDSKPEIIEQLTMSVLLNGYPIKEPIGKKCYSLEMNMIISLVPALCLNKIKETLSKTFHHIDVKFSSFTVDTFLAVRDKYVGPDSYLLLDVSGEITDVGIVTKGILKATLSFPFGKKTFYNYLCSKLEIENRDAEELFKLYNKNNLSAGLREKIVPLFKLMENAWGESFSQCIATLPKTLILPSTIFLTTDDDIKDWFLNLLQTEEHIQSTIFDHKCTVVTLEGTEFLNMCDMKDGKCDPFLMIEAIAIMRKINK